VADVTSSHEPPKLTTYELWGGHGLRLVPASPNRDWMNNTAWRNANRCLPMLMANQSGWVLLNNAPVRMRWHGGIDKASIEFEYGAGVAATVAQAQASGGGSLMGWPAAPASLFGHGIVTWSGAVVYQPLCGERPMLDETEWFTTLLRDTVLTDCVAQSRAYRSAKLTQWPRRDARISGSRRPTTLLRWES
jgi:hypothetical protein